MKHRFAVYGTLKRGFGNNRLLESSKFLGEQKIPGFKMYSLGGFPAINKANEDSNITIEVYEVDDPQVVKNVYSLEHYSGERDNPHNWYDTVDVSTKWGDAEIFYFKKDLQDSNPTVEDGVWRGYQRGF